MVNQMPSRWFAAALSVWGVLAAIGLAQAFGQDPCDAWVASEHLSPGWRYMELTSVGFNPDKPAYGSAPIRSIVFRGELDIVDPNGLIGLSPVAVNVSAFDEDGKSISAEDKSQSAPCYVPPRYTTTLWVPTGETRVEIQPHDFKIDLHMDYAAPFPTSLSRIEWSMDMLLSDSFQTVDLPFAPSEVGVEVAPGLEILIKKATAKSGSYSYSAQAKYDGKKIALPVSITGSSHDSDALEGRDNYCWWPDPNLPDVIVTDIDVLDAQGNSLWQRGETTMGVVTDHSDSGDQRTFKWTVDGYCDTCGEAALIRFTLASEPYLKPAQFVLENVPVPEP